MRKIYTINNVATFLPAERIIVSLTTRHRVKINNPTAQLLEAFIKNAGIVIPQSELYTVAWGDHGVNVTPNTLYQNISLLRKALQDAGIIGEIITTIRGKGFLFTVDNIFESAEIVTRKSNLRYFIFSFILLSILSLSVFFIFFSKKTDPSINRYRGYRLFSYINECEVFVTSTTKKLDNSKINKLLTTKLSDCRRYPYVYLYTDDIHPTISLVSCEIRIKDIIDNGKCKTDILVMNKFHGFAE